MDAALPDDMIFACLAPQLGEREGPAELLELKKRPFWMIPWLEGDHQLWQPRLFNLDNTMKSVEEAGAQGIIAIRWRIREIGDQFEYISQRS